MNEDLHDELRDVIERDYDLAFGAHARALSELRVQASRGATSRWSFPTVMSGERR